MVVQYSTKQLFSFSTTKGCREFQWIQRCWLFFEGERVIFVLLRWITDLSSLILFILQYLLFTSWGSVPLHPSSMFGVHIALISCSYTGLSPFSTEYCLFHFYRFIKITTGHVVFVL